MPNFLFVYGTLMATARSDYGRDMRERLAKESIFVGPATMQGRLYDLGSYPGLVASVDPGELVHGEVVRLADPSTSFVWLDAYEGIGPGVAGNEYERVLARARLEGGAVILAHVYRCRLDVASTRWLPSGFWNG